MAETEKPDADDVLDPAEVERIWMLVATDPCRPELSDRDERDTMLSDRAKFLARSFDDWAAAYRLARAHLAAGRHCERPYARDGYGRVTRKPR